MIMQKGKKDCLQATLSNLLKIPYEEIPAFTELYESMEDFNKEYDKWLFSRGYIRILFDYDITKLPWISDQILMIGILKKDNRDYSHAVIIQYIHSGPKTVKIELVHDPLKESDYDIKDLIQIEIITKHDY